MITRRTRMVVLSGASLYVESAAGDAATVVW